MNTHPFEENVFWSSVRHQYKIGGREKWVMQKKATVCRAFLTTGAMNAWLLLLRCGKNFQRRKLVLAEYPDDKEGIKVKRGSQLWWHRCSERTELNSYIHAVASVSHMITAKSFVKRWLANIILFLSRNAWRHRKKRDSEVLFAIET